MRYLTSLYDVSAPYLFYDLENEYTNFTTRNPDSGMRMTKLKDRDGNYTNDRITLVFNTIDNGAGTMFANSQRNVTITLQTQYGNVVATTTHSNNFHENNGQLKSLVDHMILKGTGYFKDKETLRISYNNDNGLRPFTKRFTRVITAF